jgi:PelA/Pel-15E family pectate lyase
MSQSTTKNTTTRRVIVMRVNLAFLRSKYLKTLTSGLLFFASGFLLQSTAFAATGEEHTINPLPDTPEWHAYIIKSEHWKALDNAAIATEVKALGLSEAKLPDHANEFGFEPKQADEWFKTTEGERVMAIILSYQTPSGGWSKRTDMTKHLRQKGEAFGVEKDYIPTFDNNATSTQLQLLAKAYSVTHKKIYSQAFERGLQLILDAQYPNGGWPQNYPLVGGYHDQITYNDNLIKNLMELLYSVNLGKNEFAFVPQNLRTQALASFNKGLECIKKTQVITNGQLTVWGAQHDRITLAPTKARNFEMTSLSSAESAYLLDFLMDLNTQDTELIRTVHAAAKWVDDNKISGKRWVRDELTLRDDTSAAPMWARFYEIGTNKPIFGDRDSTVHYAIGEISEERRKGYGWYNNVGNKVLEKYKRWAVQHPITN